jgi:hypothetical protein
MPRTLRTILKRQPFAVSALLRRTLVLTYAYPRTLLEPLLPPGLVLDTFGEFGFLAIGLVEANQLRPAFLPAALGCDFFLSGYRLFVRLKEANSARGLFILRSDTDRRGMHVLGNIFTHYRYSRCRASLQQRAGDTEWRIETGDGRANLHVLASSDEEPVPLPEQSPFSNLQQARRFAGPLPYTFDYEAETNSIVRILGVRKQWDPQPVRVQVLENTFLQQEPFCRAHPALANAFSVNEVRYRWNRGVRIPLETQ